MKRAKMAAKKEEYEVETVLDVRHHSKRREFLIKWKGYPRSEATWEPEDNLDCPEKVEAFDNSAAATASKKKGKGRPSKKAKMATEKEEYEVESILDVQRHSKGREFLIKWKGYPLSEATWEPEKNLDCPDKVEAFEMKQDSVSVKLGRKPKQTKVQKPKRSQSVRGKRRGSANPRATDGEVSEDEAPV